MEKDVFSTYHPIVNFVFFCAVIAFTMIFMNPVCLVISCIASLAYSIRLNGIKQVKFNLKYMLPLMLVTALINPAFNHSGVTIIAYLPTGNALTLESIIYGIAASVMLVSAVNWFSCWNSVMTTDKMTYLFGRVIPTLSLVFSMSMRFVPRFTKQLKKVTEAQKCIGRSTDEGSVAERIKNGITVLSIMVTWSLENAVETADSMKSRGYGLKGRTSFSIFTFDDRDFRAFVVIVLCASAVAICGILGILNFRYLPDIYGELNVYAAAVSVVYTLLMFMPCVLDVMEKRKWKRLLNLKI